VIVAIVRALDQQRQSTVLHFIDDIDECVTEGTTNIDRAFALELDFVGATINIRLPEIAHIRASFAQTLADLTEDGVFAFVVNTTLVLEFEGLSSVAADVWGSTTRQVSELTINDAVDD